MTLQKMHIVYKLGGESRDHAITLLHFMDQHQSGGERSISPSIEAAYRGLGAMSPVIHIKHYYEGIPRAYRAGPMVCLDPFHENEFYMYAPVGYDGTVFRPEGAIEFTEEEADIIGKGLFAGGWCDPAYLILLNDWGTMIPSDYDPETSFHYTINSGLQQPERRYVFFKPATGENITSLYDDQNRLTGLFNKAGNKIDLNLPVAAATPDWIDKSLKIDAQKPIIREFPQGPVLAYRCDDPDSLTFCPEGFERMSAAEFQWLDADAGDINLNILIPPLPLNFKLPQGQLCSPSQP